MTGPAASARTSASLFAALLLLSLAPRSWAGFTQNDVTTGDTQSDVALFDCNDDGRLDYVYSNRGGSSPVGQSSVLRNDGGSPPTFTSVSVPESVATYRTLAVGDFNRDGLVDVAFAGATGGNNVRVWISSGNCTFGLGWGAASAKNFFRMATGDLDNDGALDLIVADGVSSTNSLEIYYGDGAGGFSPVTTIGAMTHYIPRLADLNQDGRLDIVMGVGTAPSIRVWRNDTNHAYTLLNLPDAGLGVIPRSLTVADLDNDGRIDAAHGHNANPGGWAVYRSTSAEFGFAVTYSSAGLTAVNGGNVHLDAADYDADGYRDLLFAQGYNLNSYPALKVVRSTTPATGFHLALKSANAYGQGAAWGDVTGDGRLDASAGSSGGTLGAGPAAPVIKYDADTGQSIRQPPNPPTSGFSFTATGSTFTFYWGDGTDPVAGSTSSYVVAIATKPMTVSALTSTTTWPSKLTISGGGTFNLSPAYGTPFQPMLMTRAANGDNRLIMVLNPAATYYWRVATINTGNKRSEWSAEQSTLGGLPAPTVNGFLMVGRSSSTVGWNLTSGATGYTLYGSTESLSPPVTVWASSRTVGNAVTTATVYTPALDPNTTYYFFVRAHHPGENSLYSAAVATATLAARPLSAASTFSAVAGDGFTLTWLSTGNPLAVTTYTVVLSTASDFNVWATSVTLSTAPAEGPSATFTGLEGLTLYYAQVRAVNHNGVPTDYTSLGSTTTLIKTPGGLEFEGVFASSITASWVLSNGATGYTLAASTEAQNPPVTVWASSTTAGNAVTTATVFTPALEANTTYYLFVRSNAEGVSSAFSAAVSTSTLAKAPASAAQAFLGVHATSMTIAWSANGNPVSKTSYTVVLSPETPYPNSNAGNVSLSTAPAGSSLSATLTGLSGATTYYLFIAAVNHNSVPTSYVALGSSRTTTIPKTWLGTGGDKLWHTAANWDPSGAPTASDAVTIDLAESVSVAAGGASISFASLTLGKADGSRASNVTIATTTLQAGSVTIYRGAGLTQSTTHQLVFANVTMHSGSSMTHVSESVKISSVAIRTTGTFDLQAGATIAVQLLGYQGGAPDAAGSGPGGGGTDTANKEGGGGAGHGGAGGAGVGAPGGAAGASYGSQPAPVALGSGGGGSGNTGVGGDGGGAVHIEAATVKLNGAIWAWGESAAAVSGTNVGGGGGGSGGSVYIDADNFSGTGTIDADGGAGGESSNTGDGGGAGGGRVSIAIANSGTTCDISVSTSGGAAFGTAGAGAGGTYVFNQVLAGPAGFSGSNPAASSIDWSWSLSAGGKEYQLYSSTGAAGASPMSPALGDTAVSYTTTDLSPNTTYGLYVRVRGCGATPGDSSVASVPTLANPPATAVTTFTAVHQTSMTVAWTRNSNPVGITTYTVVLTTSSSYPNSDEGNVTLSTAPAGASLAATLTGLASNTLYYLFIAAINHAGTSTSYTALGSATTNPAGTVGVTVTLDPYDFESVVMNSTTHSTRAITVTNTGDVSADFSLHANTTTVNSPWTLAHTVGTGAGFDRLLLQGAFASGAPSSSDFEAFTTVISTTTRAASATVYTIDGSYTGAAVPASAGRSLWFKLTLPTSTSLGNPPGQQEITITVTADQSP